MARLSLIAMRRFTKKKHPLAFAAFACCAITLSFPSATGQTQPPGVPGNTYVQIKGERMLALDFKALSSFPYKIVDAGTGASEEEIKTAMTTDQVPSWVRGYDGQKVVLTGYMMPLSFENGVSKKFVLMRDQNTCCYGAVPNMNDYVIVTMKDRGVAPIQDIPVRLVGTFRLDQKYEGGYLVSLFVMDGDKLIGPQL